MPKFVTKPVEVNAIKFTGDNLDEIHKEFGSHSLGINIHVYPDQSYDLILTTADGNKIPCSPNMWVMQDSKPNTYYPCNNEHFQMKYEGICNCPNDENVTSSMRDDTGQHLVKCPRSKR